MDDLPEEEKPGIPAWVVTFADLMSLLMCFFVLLLSFSEIDANKFKQIAGELSKAFGVQREIPALEIPVGTSPIFDKYSPGKPYPTPLEVSQQQMSEVAPSLETNTTQSTVDGAIQALLQQTMDESVQSIQEVLQKSLAGERVHLEEDSRRIVLRIEENGSFLSGSAEVLPAFEDMLFEMSHALADIPGTLTVEGHTDNVPIRTARFQSNWDLSAMRASSVANALLSNTKLDPARLRIQGYADTRPRLPNDTAQARAANRRVEIILDLSGPLSEQEIRLRDLSEQNLQSLLPDQAGSAPALALKSAAAMAATATAAADSTAADSTAADSPAAPVTPLSSTPAIRVDPEPVQPATRQQEQSPDQKWLEW